MAGNSSSNYDAITAHVGQRVVRGPSWKWGDQDSGEGHVGTIAAINRDTHVGNDKHSVTVVWDSGYRASYRTGHNNAYDLRLFDNSAAGVTHDHVTCGECKEQGILGVRWKCLLCADYDLCSNCYLNGKHDLNHPFTRINTPTAKPVNIPKREGLPETEARGIFNDAQVTRGPDWLWGDQDGGEGVVGVVVSMTGWRGTAGRCMAYVRWDKTGVTLPYRCGHYGILDLKYVEAVSGGSYYTDHLPVIARQEHLLEQLKNGGCDDLIAAAAKGDEERSRKILNQHPDKINDKILEFTALQVATYLGHRTVVGILLVANADMELRDCYGNSALHAAAYSDQPEIMKLLLLNGANVNAVNNKCETALHMASSYQHIACAQIMIQYNCDVDMQTNDETWMETALHVATRTGHKQIAELLLSTNAKLEIKNSYGNTPLHYAAVLNKPEIMELLINKGARINQTNRWAYTPLHHAVVQQYMACVQMLIKYNCDLNMQKNDDPGQETALHVAIKLGHKQIAEVLLEANANTELRTRDENTALHYTSIYNQPDIMELLLKKGANINAVNKTNNTALHLSVSKQQVTCIKILTKRNCNPDVQNSDGNTVLHEAIQLGNLEIVELLLGTKIFSFTAWNMKGFNVLHHSAVKGNHFIVDHLLAKTMRLVNEKSKSGTTALHLAALHGHRLVAETLIVKGRCDVETKNNDDQTALFLAVLQANCSLVEMLVNKGANVNTQDGNGETPLHVALYKHSVSPAMMTETKDSDAPAILEILLNLKRLELSEVYLAVASFLAQKGADLNQKNKTGNTPKDLITDPKVKDTLIFYASLKSDNELTSSSLTEPCSFVDLCSICYEGPATVSFEPCGHKVTCNECCIRMKKCTFCWMVITKKITSGSSGNAGLVSQRIKVEVIGQKIGREWKRLGRLLNVPEHDLETIDITAIDIPNKAEAMVTCWQKICGKKATLNVLIEQLQALECNHLVEDIRIISNESSDNGT